MSQPSGPIRTRKCHQAEGLVLWYPLCSPESAATREIDHSENGNGLLTSWTSSQNSIAYMPDYGYGMTMGTSGTSRTIQDNGVLDHLTGPITISFWFRRTNNMPATTILLGCGTIASGGFIVGVTGSANNLAYFPGTTGLGTLNSNNYFDLGIRSQNVTEHHTITGQGATLTHYVNGVVATTWSLSGTQAQPTAYTSARCFGTNASGGQAFTNCTISDLRIYNRALSDAEVWGLYDPATRFTLWDTPRNYIGSYSSAPPSVSIEGDGVLEAPGAIVEASGTSTVPEFEAEGAWEAPGAAVVGTGYAATSLDVTGVGALLAPLPVIENTGSAAGVYTASAVDWEAVAAAMAGAGVFLPYEASGDGALVAPACTLRGFGLIRDYAVTPLGRRRVAQAQPIGGYPS